MSQGNAPAYSVSDAEKGLSDNPSFRTNAQGVIFEKKPEYSPRADLANVKEKENEKAVVTVISAGPPKTSSKAKKKASKWTLWRLWFNTYRYDFNVP